jgi:hypothetical protein
MKNPPALNWLVPLVGILALIASGAGLFMQDGGSPYPFTTLHGQTVQIYGQGLYRFDTLFSGAAFRGTDAIMLFVCLPLLVLAFILYRRGSLRGRFLLTSMMVCFLYNAFHMAFSAAYNNLFIVYTAYFSASLFATILLFASFDLQALPAYFSPRLPRRGIAIFMFIAGAGPFVLWLMEILGALSKNQAPALLDSYATMVTYAFDLGIIVPAVWLSAVLLLRRQPLGYLLACPLLILCAVIGLVVLSQTVFQLNAGWTYTTGELIGFVGSWIVLGLAATYFTAAFFRNLSDSPVQAKTPLQATLA